MKKWIRLMLLCGALMMGAGCRSQTKAPPVQETEAAEAVRIGVVWDTFVLERWLRDRDVFSSTATGMGAEVNIQNANGDIEKQVSQMEYLIEKGVDVIVVVAIDTDSEELQKKVKKAHDAGIKVMAYDRLLKNADVDLYISFDNERVGELMAEAAIADLDPNGKIAGILGSPTDYNVEQVERGINRILQQSGRQLDFKRYAPGWRAEYGYEYAESCFNELGDVDVIICGNDALASEVFRSLAERKRADSVRLIGQDADIDACQRIVEDQQYMTVYKDLQTLAKQAAQYAVALGQGKKINTQEVIFDGQYDVPAYCLTPVAVTKENLDEEIIDSQFHFEEEVYLHYAE